MSFYLDDYPGDGGRATAETCPNCSGVDFYNDPITGALTCSSCYTQSQTATQEELDYDEGIGLAATGKGAKRTSNLGRRGGGFGNDRKRPLAEYDRSRRLPDAESCCLAFQWLLWDASKCVSKLAGIHEENSSDGVDAYYQDEEDRRPSILERTVERIWFAYLNAWMKATEEFSEMYPEMRVSFRDFFLDDQRKRCLMRHLSVTVGKKVEEEILEGMLNKPGEKLHQDDDEDDRSISSSSTERASSFFPGGDGKSDIVDDRNKATHKKKKRKRQTFLTITKLCNNILPANPKRHPNGIYQCPPYHAALKVQPSMTLLLSILQLALTHLQSGVAPHHLTMWVSSGQLPHALNGYALMPPRLKERVEMVKPFFTRSFVPPAEVVANLTYMLATACSWFGDGMIVQSNAQSHQNSLYNVPLLAARMIQDFGFGQAILDYTLALMGVENVATEEELGRDSSASPRTADDMSPKVLPPPLKCASPEKLYTPLHVAAVIMISCKLCPNWESWKITNLHARTKADATEHSPPAFVPWNESQFQLLGNGPTLSHYSDFLEETAFCGLKPLTKVTEFFLSLDRDMKCHPSLNEDKPSTKPIAHSDKAQVTPNIILSGASNPNEPNPISDPSDFSRYLDANNIGRYTSYQYRTHNGTKLRGHKPYHPHYCRLLEYICYIIEETDSEKLHDMVEEFEKELLVPRGASMNTSPGIVETWLPCSGCTHERVTICVKKGKHCKMCYRNQPGHLTPLMKQRLSKQSKKGCAICKETICKDCWDKGYDRHIIHPTEKIS
ncbi:hypothetical protein ACHAW5_010322 [Stephanodiscus triporus]|uniref:GATA-type domain-containing protein n=1 Tax=Stephanodiscus triporus TaxID=2934178 RepID=A0ABD3NGC3_9STRA